MVMSTADMILMNAGFGQHWLCDRVTEGVGGGDSQIIPRKETFFKVRGMVRRVKTTIPTTPNTIVHVPWFESVFSAIVQVRRWLPMTKIPTMTNAAPNISLPIRPNNKCPISV